MSNRNPIPFTKPVSVSAAILLLSAFAADTSAAPDATSMTDTDLGFSLGVVCPSDQVVTTNATGQPVCTDSIANSTNSINAQTSNYATNAGDAAHLSGTLDGSQIVGSITNVWDVRANGAFYTPNFIVAPTLVGNAQTATNATNAGNATTANYATNAGNATTANSASYATNAGNATTANSATNANYASNAGNATTANSASYATNAGNATTANSATNANYASSAGNATTANSASYATNAGSASSASYASSSGSANYANSAGSASYANSAGYASDSGTRYTVTQTRGSGINDVPSWYCPGGYSYVTHFNVSSHDYWNTITTCRR